MSIKAEVCGVEVRVGKHIVSAKEGKTSHAFLVAEGRIIKTRSADADNPSSFARGGEVAPQPQKPRHSGLSDREWQMAIDAGYLGDKPVEHLSESGWHSIVYRRTDEWGYYWLIHKYEAGETCAQGGRYYVVEIHPDPPVNGRFSYGAGLSTGTNNRPANLPPEERARIFAELEQELRDVYGDNVIPQEESR